MGIAGTRPHYRNTFQEPAVKMMYQTYQAQADLLVPVRFLANVARGWLDVLPPVLSGSRPVRELSAAYALIAKTRVTHERPPFGIDAVTVGRRRLAVHEQAVLVKPFGTLLRFRKEGRLAQPKVLLVSPMACHFATLLRETAKTLLPEHDVYITDWHNARDVPMAEGAFDLDSYIAYLIEFIEAMGPGVNVVAICQPCVAALAATALMAEDGSTATPRTLTLMAGPIDTRINPTGVNELAAKHPLEWFERNVVDKVPLRYAGAGRRVYPGFLQLAGFMSMNPERHRQSFLTLHRNMVDGEIEKAAAIQEFYDEYFAVSDLPAEFYLQTMQKVFMQHELPQGRFEWRGRRVDPAAITKTALLTVEGAKDDICGVGQTGAAHDLCSRIPDALKTRHVQDGAGHYGVFSGHRWHESVHPLLRQLIQSRAAA
ncbi:MAG: polyhydroxyalkanoate depolymerase [Nevskia sp.]